MVPPQRVLGDDARRIRRFPVEDSRGVVLFCHGLGLHADKFDSLYDLVNRLGYDVVTFDAPGHGPQPEVELDSASLDLVAAEAIAVYEQFAAERPILLGTGCFGGFTTRRIIDAARDSDWVPPAIFYSVDYVRMPSVLLKAIQNDRVLCFLDRFRPGCDHRALTRDRDENARFIEEDNTVWARIPLGLGMKLAYETNSFYDRAYTHDPPHAFIVGADDTLSHLPPVLQAGQRQPDFRVWSVPGGAHAPASGCTRGPGPL